MSDRLNDLQRQRALAQEQVAWFDREIAKESGVAPAPVPATSPPAPAVTPTSAGAGVSAPLGSSAGNPNQQAEEILQRFSQTERPLRDDVRRGCFVYFFLALAVVGLAVLALYAWHQSRIE